MLRCSTPEHVRCAVVTPDGAVCVAGGLSGKLYVWELASGTLLRAWNGHYKAVSALAVTDDGGFVVSGGADGIVHAWAVAGLVDLSVPGAATAAPSAAITWSDHSLPVTSIHCGFGGSGARVVTCSADRTVRVRELSQRSPLLVVRLPAAATAVVVDALEASLFAGGDDGRIFVFDLHAAAASATARAVPMAGTDMGEHDDGSGRAVFSGHTAQITSLGLAGHGAWLVSTSVDGSARVWDVASRRQLRVFNGHKGTALHSLLLVPRPAELQRAKPVSARLPIAPLRKTVGTSATREKATVRVRLLAGSRRIGSSDDVDSLESASGMAAALSCGSLEGSRTGSVSEAATQGVAGAPFDVAASAASSAVDERDESEIRTLQQELNQLRDENRRWQAVNQQLFARVKASEAAGGAGAAAASTVGSSTSSAPAEAADAPTPAKAAPKRGLRAQAGGRSKRKRKGK